MRMEVLYTLMAYSPSLPSAWYTFASLPVLTHLVRVRVRVRVRARVRG
jgi:hypothetical protein